MKTKQILLTIFFFTLTSIINAQNKFEYMVIEFNQTLRKEFQISIDGKQYLEETADYSPGERAMHNANPLLKKVTEYESKGWELMYFHSLAVPRDQCIPVYIAYMKKTKIESK